MTPEQFRAWRLDRRRSTAEVAEELGVSLRAVQLWERGAGSRGTPIAHIPRTVALACLALSHGLGRTLPVEAGSG